MHDITKQYVLKVIADGIRRHGNITAYEKAVGLNKQAVKDIRKSKKCPPADIWQKIAREAGLEQVSPRHETETIESQKKTVIMDASDGKHKKKLIMTVELI